MLDSVLVICVILVVIVVLFFFFKQKTAYEMRISDWSSDVCSSDLWPNVADQFGQIPAQRCANMDVRQIVIGDARSVQAIYAPYVTDTAVSFEDVPPDIMEVERRIAAILPRYPYLVAEEYGRIVGYPYASEYRTRAASRQSVHLTAMI